MFFKNDKSLIIHDSVFTTNIIQPNSIDLIVTSPPYNVDIKYNSHDDQLTYEEYKEFSRSWIARCYDWLKDDGRFCLNIPLDKNKGGKQSVGADLTLIAKSVGFHYHSTIIWNEGNISKRTAWGSWVSASAPYVIAPVELIVVFYKRRWKKSSGTKESTIKRKNFLNWTNGLWSFSGESKKKIGHPAPFPVALPMRCIQLFSYKWDTVLDPFSGSGSTLVASCKSDRFGIGIDIDVGYCTLARDRLEKETGEKFSQKPDLIFPYSEILNENNTEVIMNFFKMNSNQNIRYSQIQEWLEGTGRDIKFFDKYVRNLVKNRFLTRVEKGIFRYDA